MAEAKSFAPQLRTAFELVSEFRKRFMIIIILLVAGSVIGYLNTGWLMDYLFARVGTVIYTSPAEGFLTQIKLAITIGLILTLPLMIYIVANFIRQKSPALASKNIVGFIGISYGLFWVGLLLAFFMIMPLAITFLLGFQSETLAATFSAASYVSFVTMLCMAFGFAFQLPVIINLLSKAGLVSARALESKRKIMIVVVFAVAAFITPPDVISQVALAIPLLGLYEISIQVAKHREKKEHEQRMKMLDPTNPNGLSIEEWQDQQKKKLMKDLGMTEAEYDAMIQSQNEMFGLGE